MTWQQYAAAWAHQHGGYDLRRGPTPVRGWLWTAYAVARGLASVRVRPGFGFWIAVGCAALVPLVAGRGVSGLLGAALLTTLSGFAASVDAALTVLTRGVSARAAVRAVLVGRIGELAALTGLWQAGVPAPLLVGCGALAVLYESARREAMAAGLSRLAVQTVGELPVRTTVMVIGYGSAALAWLTGLVDAPLAAGLLTVAVGVWLLLALLGAGQLVSTVRRTLV